MRRLMLVIGVAAGVVAGFYRMSPAVQIPLDHVSVNEDGTQAQGAIGYVDIDRVFREHPQTERSQAEFSAEVDKRRATAAERQKSLDTLIQVRQSSETIRQQAQDQLAAMRSSRDTAVAASGDGTAVQVSSTAVLDIVAVKAKENEIAALDASLAIMREDIEKLKTEIHAQAEQDRAYLQEWEEKRTNEVLGDLYDILQDIATTEHITIIFDKTNILYGQGARDISDLVRERMKGR